MEGKLGINKTFHSPLRLQIMLKLFDRSWEFQELKSDLNVTSGNLSVQLHRLQEGGHVEIRKSFKDKVSNTKCEITSKGRQGLIEYKKVMLKFLK